MMDADTYFNDIVGNDNSDILDLEQDTKDNITVGRLIQHYEQDNSSVPICVLGYHVIGRSMSIRGDMTVPTHIIIATSAKSSMAPLTQRGGRAQGRTMEQLESKKVKILCTDNDWQVLINYNKFVMEYIQWCVLDSTFCKMQAAVFSFAMD